jgi:putative transcriptional regulator
LNAPLATLPISVNTIYMSERTFLTNHFLIAMPALDDPFFYHAVAYICEHNENGAIGILVNRPMSVNLSDVFKQLEIEVKNPNIKDVPILFGGPIHQERGFVIHRPAGHWRSTFQVDGDIGITTSRDVLQAIADGDGPNDVVISLGCAGWTAGQLEEEMGNNVWLSSPASASILFDTPFESRWSSAAALIGVDITILSDQAGHA